MKGQREVTLAAGCVWVMSKDMKNHVPLKYKLAANELAKQFHRINCTHWEEGCLSISVFRDEDTLNPNYYDIVIRNRVMYRQEARIGGTFWPIYKTETTPQLHPADHRRGVRRSRTVHKPQPVREDGLSNSTHAMFCERAEAMDDLKNAEMKFELHPTVEGVMQLGALRQQMTQIEMRIAASAYAENATREIARL